MVTKHYFDGPNRQGFVNDYGDERDVLEILSLRDSVSLHLTHYFYEQVEVATMSLDKPSLLKVITALQAVYDTLEDEK